LSRSLQSVDGTSMNQERLFVPRSEFARLPAVLAAAGYRCIGPTARDGAIVYADLSSVEHLPRGIVDAQAPGSYRLEQTDSERYFSWAVGPQALKPLLFAPRDVLWRADRDAQGQLRFRSPDRPSERIAVIGMRACDLAALALLDQHFLYGQHADPAYGARRAGLLLIAVNCSHPASTCFCASTGDGPHAREGFDIALTELDDGFVAHAGSAAGGALLDELTLVPATEAQRQAEAAQEVHSARTQSRALPGRNLRDALLTRRDHPRWAEVAERCLACANCTQVCPSCFCHTQQEQPDIGGGHSEHVRVWDSCFTAGHAWLAGYQVRPDTRTRYRQWLTHKLGTWHDQYGRSGCVGCGRCITWCPVGIDLTEEAHALCMS
jgi:ferredoxin